MHKKLSSLIIALVFFFSGNIKAQTFELKNTSKPITSNLAAVIPDQECGTEARPTDMANMRNLWQSNQVTESNFLNNFNSTNKAPITVPIKAHIIRTSAGTGGLTLANLNAAIATMNGYYINANMEFYLCGGINYIDNSTYYDFDASDEAALTGPNNDPNNINIYFMNSATSNGSSLCGYAYFPGGPNNIIMANSCAINGSTLSHEMGHFYALYHTHGTTNTGTTTELVNGSNCTTAGDEICDTPADPNLSGVVNTSCIYTGTAVDANFQTYNPDPNNVMSYSRKACRTFFSPGQYARINSTAINSSSRNNYTCPVIITEDASIDTILHPTDGEAFCDNPLIPKVVLQNLGTSSLSSVSINYQINNGPVNSFSWTGSLLTLETDTVTLPTISPPIGTFFTLKVYTSDPNSLIDNDNSNDTLTVSTQYTVGIPAPYTQEFGGGGTPIDFTIFDQEQDGFQWEHDNSVNGYGTGTNVGSMMVNNYNNDTRNTLDWLILPTFDLSVSSSTKLTFDVAYARYSASWEDSLYVVVNADCGTTYTSLYHKGDIGLATAPDISTSIFIPAPTEWRTDTVDLSAYDGMSHVKLAFVNQGGWGQALYVDNINIIQNCIVNSIDPHTLCDSLLWIDGNTYYTSNNTAKHSIFGGATGGCDSVITLDLTVNYTQKYTDIISSCFPLVWIDGNTYSTSNNSAFVSYPNGAVNGCDSIATLNFTRFNSTTGTDTRTECDSLVWIDGNTYTNNNNSATFNIVGGSSTFCDSLVTLNLTFLGNSATGIDTKTECSPFVWIDGNTYTNNNNSATYNIAGAAANMCDSLVTLNLTISGNSSAGVDTRTECNPFIWIDGNFYTANNNSATYTIPGGAANSCDSIVTINLTVITVATSVTNIQPTLSVNTSGLVYQWIDCATMQIITNETNQTYTATTNGSYAVIVTQNGCTDTSACYSITSTDIEKNMFSDQPIKIFPNPNEGFVNLSLGTLKDVTINVLDINGKTIYQKENINKSTFKFELNQSSGVYFIEINSEGKTQQYKLLMK